MTQVTDQTFENISTSIVEDAEELTLAVIIQLREIAERLSDDPDAVIRIQAEIERLQGQINTYEGQARQWVDENLSEAYKKGVEYGGQREVVSGFSMLGLLASSGGGGDEVSAAAREVLEEYPEHWTAYRVFQNSAYNDFFESRLPIIRDVQDKIRDLTIQASDNAYRTADTLTRRKLSQRLMNEFAQEGITGIRYSNGRTYKLDSYSEMVARTQTKNAWNEANWNRIQQYGEDLIVMSVHYPSSPMCEPYQGGVYSISGQSTEYPSLQSAIEGGAWHPLCKHTSSQYTGEVPATPVTKERNSEMYAAQQRQRQIERNIKKYKRRKAASLTEEAEQNAQKFISKWQGEQRKLIDNNSFLRRKWSREQI